MARRKDKSFLGDFSGKVGRVVLTTWLDIVVLKSRPVRKRDNKPSDKQAAEQEIFGKIMRLLNQVVDLINIGFQQPRISTQSRINEAVSWVRTNAMISFEGQRYIDLTRIKLSRPKYRTQTTWNPTVMAEPGRKITVSWQMNPFPHKCTQPNDCVIIVFLDKEETAFGSSPESLERSALSFSKIHPAKMIGHELHYYMFLVSADGKFVSETDYLGTVTVME